MSKPLTPEIRFKGYDDEWGFTPLVNFAQIYGGLTYSPTNIRSHGTLVLRSSNVKDGQVISADDVFVDSNVVNVRNVEVGDIIMVVRNGSKALIGKHAPIIEDMPSTVIGAFMSGLKTNEPYFFTALFDTNSFSAEVNKNAGATINQITGGMFKQMNFHIPSGLEQKEIGNYFRKLQLIISESEREISRLEKMKSASLQKMFPRPGETTPEIRIGSFDGEWEMRSIGSCFSEAVGRGGFDNLLSVGITRGVYPTEDFVKTVTVKDFSNYKTVNVNDIVYNSMRMWQGASGYSRYEGIVSPAYTVMTPKDYNHSPFFAILFKLPWVIKIFEANSQGLTKDTWNLKYPAISKIVLPVPPDAKEQIYIAHFFDNLDALIDLKRRKLAKLRNLKQSCLDKMFVNTTAQ